MSRRTTLRLAGAAVVLVLALAIVSGLALFSTPGGDQPAPQTNGPSAGVISPGSSVTGVVDCIGNGATCEGSINGSDGGAHVTNNPNHNWRLKLTCDYGGDQWSGLNKPSADKVTSRLSCQYGAPAKYWNVIVQP